MTIRELIDAAHLDKYSLVVIEICFESGEPYRGISGNVQSLKKDNNGSLYLDRVPSKTTLEVFIPVIGTEGPLPRIRFTVIEGGSDNASSKADL